MNNYYDMLGIAENAGEAEIRAAYVQMIKRYHPDIYHSADGEAKTQAINEAYACLKNADSRAEYDMRLAEFRAAEKAGKMPSEAEILAGLEADFADRLQFWQGQISERLRSLSKEKSAALKSLFIAHEKVTDIDYNKLAAEMAAQMQSYKAAKLQAAKSYYTAAASPEFEPQSLLKIKALGNKAQQQLEPFYGTAGMAAAKALYEVFTSLDPEFIAEKLRKKEEEKKVAEKDLMLRQDEEYSRGADIILIVILLAIPFIFVIISMIGR